MQIPIDMTTFTYCIFALGHILARQFPIVGFRPPVRLIDIIGRAADTRLHFYLHTFAHQFACSPRLSVPFGSLLSFPPRIGIFRLLSRTPTIGERFSLCCRALRVRAIVHACHIFTRENASKCDADRRRQIGDG